jgi:hypothetical protein
VTTSYGNAGPWKAWKTKIRFSTPPHRPWKSLPRFPHSHSFDDWSKTKPRPALRPSPNCQLGGWAKITCQTHVGRCLKVALAANRFWSTLVPGGPFSAQTQAGQQ